MSNKYFFHKKICFGLALIIFFPNAIFSQTEHMIEEIRPSNRSRTVIAQEVTFTPAHFYLGDDVILHFWLHTLPDEQVESGLYPQQETLLIENIELIRNQTKVYVSIHFKSFAVGTQSLDLYFGDVQVEPIPITTRSLVNEGYDQARDIYPPLLLPKTKFFAITITSILLLGVPLILLIMHVIKQILLFYKKRSMIPYRIFIKSIAQLMRNESQLTDAQYYHQLNQSMRHYLTHQLSLPTLPSATPLEMRRLLMDIFPQESSQKLMQIIQRSDSIRFGGHYAEVGEREADTTFMLSLAKELEISTKEAKR
ncbi:hypothetical protein [Entomospira culicis]|uniref:Uncharacterized protein n=1 Tax=Entomospira culicis TaxID=2719989 RepID=A0A968GET5_9SPIO|nr:hypothetical protein [Entomospira culicis]NIZ18722.1 hypothetical protein [Entomospira culicis]NIZ68937.1 hypothetical protein [Entomospira culicis]WDI37529.1 hypothetical protein PVA46_01710 [Entomospira culicis]WDI39157.1 hypothetical protein PVA47_01715 [Entomospira culicis]